MAIKNKYDFIMYFTVKGANPNGDPLNQNKPRVNFDGFGEISNVCIKRKLRNRLMEFGENIFVQPFEQNLGEFTSLQDKFESCEDLLEDMSIEKIIELSNKKWIDVRSFGQVFDFTKSKKLKREMSIGIRGPVSIHPAISEEQIKIYKVKNLDNNFVVDFATYKLVGSINSQLSESTGFNNEDVEIMKKALLNIFNNDSSILRPEGSMKVNKLYWFKHKSKLGDYPSSLIHNCISLEVKNPKIKEFARYEIIENIPKTFRRIDKETLVELVD